MHMGSFLLSLSWFVFLFYLFGSLIFSFSLDNDMNLFK